jgi:hypothetical protein
MRRANKLSRRKLALGLGVLGAASVGAAGCRLWDDFTRIGQEASSYPVSGEQGGGPRFGRVLAGYSVPVLGRTDFLWGSRLYVGGQAAMTDTPATFAVFGVWQELQRMDSAEILTLPEPERDPGMGARFLGCGTNDRDQATLVANCGTGRRTAAGFPYLHTSAAPDWWGCVAVTTGLYMGNERLQLRCEAPDPQTALMLPLENGLGFGASAAGVPIDHPLGGAVFGAPDTDGTGALFRLRHLRDQQMGLGMGQPEGGDRRGRIAFEGLDLADGAEFGRSVALTVVGTSTVRVAVAFGATRRTVVVADVVEASPTVARAQVVGCVAGSADDVGFGDALAFGDFDGDGAVDLAVGSQPIGAEALDRPVQIFDGADLDAPTTCSESAVVARAAVSFGCSEGSSATPLDCQSSRFGETLAAGDLNGDGIDDLAVGAPGATTTAAGTGVVQTIRGASALATVGQDATGRGTLWFRDSGVASGFGIAVATLPAPYGRADLAISQAEPPRTAIFFCSDLEGDRPASARAPSGASVVRGCGIKPGSTTTSMLDPRLTPRGAMPTADAGVPDAALDLPDAAADLADAGM